MGAIEGVVHVELLADELLHHDLLVLGQIGKTCLAARHTLLAAARPTAIHILLHAAHASQQVLTLILVHTQQTLANFSDRPSPMQNGAVFFNPNLGKTAMEGKKRCVLLSLTAMTAMQIVHDLVVFRWRFV